jgi:hypothetical protein
MQLDAEKFLACVMVTGLVTAAGCGRSGRHQESAKQSSAGGESAATAPACVQCDGVQQRSMDYRTEQPGYESNEGYGAPGQGFEEPPPSRNLQEPSMGQEEPAPVTE